MICSLLLVTGNVYADNRTLNVDIVVIGSGAAGMPAAVTAAQGGAQVILLEKNAFLGGAANFAEGLFAVESENQRVKSYGLTKDEAFKHIMEFAHYKVNAQLTRKFVNESAENIQWLHEQGVNFEAIQISPTEPLAWHIIKDYQHFVHGSALIVPLQEKAKALGVEMMTRTPATKLLFTNGRVTGVEATDHRGNVITIHAKAVIIASGGFGNSKEKIAEWTDYDAQAFRPTLPLNKTGDGIQMSKDVGASTEGWGLMLHPGTEGTGIVPLGAIYTMVWQPSNMWVNQDGERFADETVAFSFAQAGNAIGRQRDHYGWAIFDEAAVHYAMNRGVDNGVGVIVPVMTKLTDLPEEIKNALAINSESFKSASSIEALAKEIGVPVEALKTTLDRYNQYATNHYDQEMAKEHRWLRPINTGKFYAVKIMPYHFVSLGGVRTNLNMAVLDQNDKPIPGLYAAGMDVGGLHGDTYTLWASGHAYGFSTYSGRLAALSALEDIQK